MLFRHCSVIVILVSFVGLLYGIYNLFSEVEENSCRMTYMFGKPQFSRVQIEENHKFPNYGLYFYYESNIQRNVHDLHLFGAPVIFVPGNGGSAKQVRSLASVALRKAMDIDYNVNLNYFTIDYNEELSALYGGYLEGQKEFLKICIRSVLNLYRDAGKTHRQVVLIGHSMGGIIAQAVLEDANIAILVNSIIFISSPLSRPVLNIDRNINDFYVDIHDVLNNHRHPQKVDSDNNICCEYSGVTFDKPKTALENTLLLSIGGGNRDLLVQDKLTVSQFSDIHAMTSSIPEVYLSCDHLASVWCLQLVLVINRFLFNILRKDEDSKMSKFKEDKILRLQAASHYFVKSKRRQKFPDFNLKDNEVQENAWHEDTKKVTNKLFKNGIKRTYNQLIQLGKFTNYRKLYIQVSKVEEPDWLYGCVSQVKSGSNICTNGTSLSHVIQNVPSHDGSMFLALIDLDNIRKTFDWTHIVVRLLPTNKKVNLNIDVYDLEKRHFHIGLPPIFDFKMKTLVNETVQGSLYYKVYIKNFQDTFQSLKINIMPTACLRDTYTVTTKVCVPWARGFERYKVLSNTKDNSIFVNVPIPAPLGYNTTKNAVVVELFLDPSCRYSITYQTSIANMLSRTIQEFYQWLPAHFASVLLIVLKNQITKPHNNRETVPRPFTGFFQSISLYIITGCRLLKKLLLTFGFLRLIDVTEHSLIVSLFVHGVAITLSIIASFLTWMALTLHGNIFQNLALRLTKIRPITSSTLLYIMESLPISFGVLIIAVAFVNSGLALILATVYYFMQLSNAYKDYLETWIMKTATGVLKRTFRKPTAKAPENKRDVVTYGTSSNQSPSGLNTPENNSVDDANDEQDSCIGLQNFSYHITLLLLLCLMVLLNINITIAWAMNKGTVTLVDPSLWPTVVILGCLSILWQLNAPNQLLGCQVLSVILYVCASSCVIYCQEAIYRLNYIISIAFSALLLFEVINRVIKRQR